MHLDFRHNVREVERSLSDAARRQLPFAAALAVNEVLGKIKRNTEKRLRRVLDRPTAFTMRAFAIRRASKRKLQGAIFAKDIQAEYLQWAETGGTRRPKGKAILVPVGQRLNKFGNMPRGSVQRNLAKPNVFSGRPKGGRAAGIYRRGAGKAGRSKLRLLVSYETRALYRKRLGFMDGGQKTSLALMPQAFFSALTKAMKTGA